MLSSLERELVPDIMVEEVGGKVPIVAGTSSVNPVVVIEQSLHVTYLVLHTRCIPGRYSTLFRNIGTVGVSIGKSNGPCVFVRRGTPFVWTQCVNDGVLFVE